MPLKSTWTSFYTILRKDVVRIFRIWPQTFLPSIVTSVLYFLVFGTIIGSQLGDFNGVSYIHFIIPGLVLLAVVTNAFTNTASTFFQAKFFSRNIDEILVSPTPPWVIIGGFVAGGMVRGILVGLLVLTVSVFFALPPLMHPFVILLFLILSSMIFALAGLVNGIYAKSFDGITIIPTFVLTPLIYLGGVFYSVASLPAIFKGFTLVNPIFYLVNGFRYGFLGFSDVSLSLSISVLLLLATILIAINWYLLRTGLGLKQ
ncbi:MAG: ABC transporter permease [Candidatus Pacebacteria bacterium]|nr:ABC transporter permease [Candidatus Paceibacterota bacterium]MBP9832085.1 ABC transporter permease [Candidatus Paceibacterota bacterium]